MGKVSKAEYAKQFAPLREWVKPGDTIYTILEHVSRSGMQRTIRTVIPYTRDDGQIDHLHPNYAISVITGNRLDKGPGRDGVKVGGCGMDMGFHLVNSVSEALYGGKRCRCGAWYHGENPEPFTRLEYDKRADRNADNWRFRYVTDCPSCKGSGNVAGTGYQCLGKGKCPSNYHTNHRNMIRCDGVHRDGEWIRCAIPQQYGRYAEEIPADWPTRAIMADAEVIATLPLYTLFTPEGDYGREICPTCNGTGEYPNPEGPERFDLEHFDGYAIRHKWL